MDDEMIAGVLVLIVGTTLTIFLMYLSLGHIYRFRRAMHDRIRRDSLYREWGQRRAMSAVPQYHGGLDVPHTTRRAGDTC